MDDLAISPRSAAITVRSEKPKSLVSGYGRLLLAVAGAVVRRTQRPPRILHRCVPRRFFNVAWKGLQIFAVFLVALYIRRSAIMGRPRWLEDENITALRTGPLPLPQLWPAPLHVKLHTSRVRMLDPREFRITSNCDCDVLERAISRYHKRLGQWSTVAPLLNSYDGGGVNSVNLLTRLRVVVARIGSRYCGYPSPGADESYVLKIPVTADALLKSETVWGALRGLETFSQMVQAHPLSNYGVINCGKIRDMPRFSHRGILIDSARHFLPVPVIKQNLDAMAYNKLNVLHWHVVDDQSWPLHLEAFPNLTLKGAYSPRHVYSPEDVRSIVEYARLRGIRVIPELDTPGHTQALGKAFPDVLTPCYATNEPGTAAFGRFASFEILDPTRNFTYQLVHNLLLEIRKLFPDPYVHLGMDEVYYACWTSNPRLEAFQRYHGLDRANELEQHYVNTTLYSLDEMGLKVMIWQDPIDNGVIAPNNTVVELWKAPEHYDRSTSWQHYAARVAKKGYHMVVSSSWYVDHFNYDNDWSHYYNTDPTSFDGTPEQKQLVLGGEACMWGEYADMTNLVAALWPRAAAIAERLWSAASVNKTEETMWRLNAQRCRMLRRGIPVHPLNSLPCDNNEELDFSDVFVVE